MNIILDFDGTCVSYQNPGIGKDIGAVPVLRELVHRGHNLILFTARPNNGALAEAVNWFRDRDIPLYGIQKDPEQEKITDSPKALGDLIIDDIALGIPLKRDLNISLRPFVDWFLIRRLLVSKGYL